MKEPAYNQRIRSPRGKTHAWNGYHTACNAYRPRQIIVGLTLVPPDATLSCTTCIMTMNAQALRTLGNVTGALRKHGLLP